MNNLNKKEEYLPLINCLKEATKKFKNNQNYDSELSDATNHMENYMKDSTNPAKTGIEIERICLEFDKSICVNKPTDEIDALIKGCDDALADLDKLQNNPDQYIKDYLTKN